MIAKLHLKFLFLSFIICLTALNVSANTMRSSLFSKADSTLSDANEAKANLLAPESYAKGMKLYKKAEQRFSKNKSIERIKKDLALATAHFRKATEDSKLASVSFQGVLKARSDALAADAKKQASEIWKSAELKFADAASTMEGGNLKRSKKKGTEAERLYRSAELNAIKSHYLNGARGLIAKTKKLKVNKFAPKTLYNAKVLLEKAEKELNENRYDTDYARSLARQARYEAQHAIYLAKKIEELEETDITIEEFLLTAEKPLAEIASLLDHVAEFEEGPARPTAEIKAKIEALQRDSYELGERRTELSFLEKEIALLEKRLGVQSERLALQEAQKAKRRRATELFSRSEAMILTQGENLLIRPMDLTFSPGSAQIETRNFAILKKLQRAIEIYEGYEVVVEGHTDSFGSDATNLTLSQERAEAVRTYLLSNMTNVSANDVEAIGYGETNPIANNETIEGRKRNRRIDFVLKPKS